MQDVLLRPPNLEVWGAVFGVVSSEGYKRQCWGAAGTVYFPHGPADCSRRHRYAFLFLLLALGWNGHGVPPQPQPALSQHKWQLGIR